MVWVLFGGLIPPPNHHAGYRQIDTDLEIGFFARNGDGGDGDGPWACLNPYLQNSSIWRPPTI